ncbi:MAG: DUF1553 domain-containing protein [Phycisphaeraceae bacterium]|nr:DUF1553 domain-containing protein [Phycisphaeraceae bacterium]
MRIAHACMVIATAIPVAASSSYAAAATDQPVSFNRTIRPLLSRCLPCHGPDEAARLAGLRLDRHADAVASRRRGAAIVPGDGNAGSLLARITSEDPEQVMPPPGAGEPLTAAEIELIRRWIEEGADYETHWAWRHPEESGDVPTAGEAWARRDLDRFVAAAHAAAGVTPSVEADRAMLARRVSLDLTGLPPTPEDVDAFLGDARPDAYERFVDGLLADPAFGERWARVWLDVARYADTRGYEADRSRTMWPWRDWVIDAFNDDLPFDRFTVAQLAGDLLPGGDDASVLATAFHRNTMTNDEGGTRDEEFRVAAVADRVNTTLTTWMGLTAECAACHDHKYDPISTAEYYGLYAFFNTTQDADRPDEHPLLSWVTPGDRTRRNELRSARDRTTAERDRRALEAPASSIPADRIPILPDARPPGAIPSGALVRGALPWDDGIDPPPGWHRSRRLEAPAGRFQQHFVHDIPPGSRITTMADDRLEAWIRLDPARPPAGVMIQIEAVDGGWEHRAYWGTLEHALGAEDTGSRRRIGDLPSAEGWVRLEWPAEVLDLPAGSVITGVAASMQAGEQAALAHWGPVGLIREGADPPRWLEDVDAWIDAEMERGGRHLPGDVRSALMAGEDRDATQRARLEVHWRAEISPPGLAATRADRVELARLDAEIDALEAAAPRVPVLREQVASERRTTNILERGDWRSPGGVVDAGVPEFLHDLPSDAASEADRLAFARWVADDRNPLTARVHVNRVWERFFGRGLVETLEDFGTQGIPPAHQDLLDHLAVGFMEQGWSHKRLCREIVTSATYRQSSVMDRDSLARDPDNELLARGPRFRLEAEAIRDAALEASGLRSPKMFGPPVYPPQPDGVWQVVYSGERWMTAEDDARHRRGLYTFWRRTAPYPSMVAFDAGSRETCVARRIRTNTPLQALVTLNDEAFVEAAGGLARRAWSEAGSDGELVRAVRLAIARRPDPREIDVLQRLLEAETQRFRDAPERAAALIEAARATVPDGLDAASFAARIVVANVILNLDEFLNRG